MRLILFLLALSIGVCLSTALELDGDVVWLYSSTEEESSGIDMAVQDLTRDWYKVFGVPPTIFSSPQQIPANWKNPVLIIGCNTSFVAQAKSKIPSGNEAYAVVVLPVENQSYEGLFLVGNDTRGTIYSIYTFSESVLGVDPWWYWTDNDPTFRGNVSISDTFSIIESSPVFENRGWFVNDEDLLGGWKQDPYGEQVFSIEMWDYVFQTALRNRINCFIVGTVPYADENSLNLGAKRGLKIISHHFNIMLDNTFRWPAGVPFSFASSPEIMEHVWNATLTASRPRESMWVLGYRGLNDYPFWIDDPEYNTPQKRGALISQAMAKQQQMVYEIYGSDTEFYAFLWAEQYDLYMGGFLTIPPNTNLVWTDDGYGNLPNSSFAKPGDGIYYHTAMFNGYANQLSEMVPPERIFAQLNPFVNASATKFFMLNLSDLRPYVLGSHLVSRYIWNPNVFLNLSPQTAQQTFLNEFAQLEFGDTIGSEISKLYSAYFSAPVFAALWGDNAFASAMRNSLSSTLANSISSGVLSQIQFTFAQYNSSSQYFENLYDQAYALFDSVPASRQSFYQSHLCTQIGINRFGLNAAYYSAKGALAAVMNHSTSDAISFFQAALNEIDLLFAERRKAESGKWSGMYQFDKLTNFANTRNLLRQVLATLTGSVVPPMISWSSTYYDFTDYQFTQQANYPLFYPNEFSIMNWAVSLQCASAQCVNTAVGGNFTASTALVQMKIPIQSSSSVEIRYTTDGSDPSSSSTLYTTPITISSSATYVNARSFIAGVAYAVSRSKWFRNS